MIEGLNHRFSLRIQNLPFWGLVYFHLLLDVINTYNIVSSLHFFSLLFLICVILSLSLSLSLSLEELIVYTCCFSLSYFLFRVDYEQSLNFRRDS